MRSQSSRATGGVKRQPGNGSGVRGIVLASLLSLGWATAPAAGDDYLSDLEAEAGKVEATPLDAEATSAAPAADTGEETAAAVEQRERFEALLQKHYFGTYGFYRKLPERSRQEVFEDYRRGVGMDEIRRKIVSRLLQH